MKKLLKEVSVSEGILLVVVIVIVIVIVMMILKFNSTPTAQIIYAAPGEYPVGKYPRGDFPPYHGGE